ncbi:MAG: hypothetical protein FWD53_02145, partial [Phycisphaerales bacterium]|nr:hypothetical protein [Phycisphaerales bacterium]
MLRVIVRQTRSGMVLAEAIANPCQPEQTLFPAGHVLDAKTIARLHESGVYDLCVESPALEFLAGSSPTPQQLHLSEAIKRAFVEQSQRSGSAITSEHVNELMNAALKIPCAVALAERDDGLLHHSANVCALGMLLGLRLKSYVA